jgi:hypothetical protein
MTVSQGFLPKPAPRASDGQVVVQQSHSVSRLDVFVARASDGISSECRMQSREGSAHAFLRGGPAQESSDGNTPSCVISPRSASLNGEASSSSASPLDRSR